MEQDYSQRQSYVGERLISTARGLSRLSRFACTFFFLAWGIGVTRFLLFFSSSIESISTSSHENFLSVLLLNLSRCARFHSK